MARFQSIFTKPWIRTVQFSSGIFGLIFVNIVGKERVIAGTDCGFGTFAGFGNVDPDIAYLKLKSLVEGASKVK